MEVIDIFTRSIFDDIRTDGAPILILGRRPKPRDLEGFVVRLDASTFAALRDIANRTLAELGAMEAADWHPSAVAAPGEEYAVIDVRGLPAPKVPTLRQKLRPRADSQGEGSRPADFDGRDVGTDDLGSTTTAGLMRLIASPDSLAVLQATDLDSYDFRLYAIVWTEGLADGLVAFVGEFNPVALVRRAHSFYSFDGVLRAVPAPSLSLNAAADLVITDEAILILRPTAFDHLFSDVRALLNDVPADVSKFEATFKKLPFSSISLKAIESVCASRPMYAKRLRQLAAEPHLDDITPALLRRALVRHGADPHDFIQSGVVEIDRDEVGELFDVLEGRWYEADFSREPRRAEIWSKRRVQRRVVKSSGDPGASP